MVVVAIALLAAMSALVTTSPSARGQAVNAQKPSPTRTAAIVDAVSCIGMTVEDMDRSIAFYHDVLSFEKTADAEVTGEEYEHLQGVFGIRMRIVTMKLGEECIELTEYLVPKGRPIPQDSRSNDRWFQHIAIITNDMDRAYEWLRKNKVRHASTGPQLLPSWNKNAGGIQAFYFKDPDDHVLEILQFPPDKGAEKWRQRAARSSQDQFFLGIDHTAIVVGDTDKSLAFYRDTLGMEIAGTSENYGTEQEHLNNVFGARLRITSLRPANGTGPSIEFLEYIAPRNGRPYPTDAQSNDLLHWQTSITTSNLGQAVRTLDAQHVTWISPGSVTISKEAIGFRKAALLRDPDGHAIRLVEP
jgi:catechol 2,3-dioxygenase-like lactoylglutathione lyase family enzyme